MSDIRVRFAPSPTGELHIGGARTALFNYLFVRSVGGTFVLRIDDTDLERSRSEYIDKLIASMHWLGLNWDEGPYYQSKRLVEYKAAVEKLITERKAYHCFCSIEDLAVDREAARNENRTYLYPGTCRNLTSEEINIFIKSGKTAVTRLLTPDQGVTVVKDEIRGEVSFENSGIDDFIIIKSNGLPTYNFASIVDDLEMEITDIIRAEEHLSNTPRQQLCAVALGARLPRFAHVPMILAPDRSKLSKRHGATAVEEFRTEGLLPEALINYIALLGWSPGGEEELFSLADLINKFKMQKVNKNAAIYDTDKLTWMNSHYIREYNLDKLVEAARPFFEKKGLIDHQLTIPEHNYLKKVITAVRERAKTLLELADASTYFYQDHYDYDEKGDKKHFTKEGIADLMRTAAEALRELEPFDMETTEKKYHSLSEDLEISAGSLIAPTRLALTGRTGGPGLFEIMALLGQERTVERLERAATYVDQRLSFR